VLPHSVASQTVTPAYAAPPSPRTTWWGASRLADGGGKKQCRRRCKSRLLQGSISLIGLSLLIVGAGHQRRGAPLADASLVGQFPKRPGKTGGVVSDKTGAWEETRQDAARCDSAEGWWTTTGKQPQSVDNHWQATAKRGQLLASIRKATGDWQRLEADGWVCSLGRWEFMGAGRAGRECMLCRDASSDQLAVLT